jgi:hypothetical protein
MSQSHTISTLDCGSDIAADVLRQKGPRRVGEAPNHKVKNNNARAKQRMEKVNRLVQTNQYCPSPAGESTP